MAKKQATNENEKEDNRRQSRKETLRAGKQDEQMRVIRIAAIIVGAILLLVLGIAIVNEYILTPNKSVATVDGEGISLSDWQDRVTYERAQRILALESQLEAFDGDVGLVQQFSEQSIIELIRENTEGMGEVVLDRMVDEEIMRQAAEDRGLLPSEADIDESIGESFSYYGGDSPPPLPDPTETVAPTPSVTPIPVDGASDTEPAAEPLPSEAGPTSTPFPTATPVSEESFQQEFDDLLAQFSDQGVSEKTYRSVVANAIITERLIDSLAEEEDLPEEDVHASMYFLAYSDEEEANEALNEIAAGDFLTVWNSVQSTPLDPEAENPSTASASEILWRTRDAIANGISEEVAENVFGLPLDTSSDLLVITGSEGEPFYIIILVSGREVRDLAEDELEGRKQALLFALLDKGRIDDVVISELWRSRVPSSPLLDPKFRQAPTPVPDIGLDDTGGTGTDDGQTTP